MEEVDGSNGVISLLPVFHYFLKDEVGSGVELSKDIGWILIFDSVGKLVTDDIQDIRNMGIRDVEGLFYVNDPKQELNWSGDQAFYKAYMLELL